MCGLVGATLDRKSGRLKTSWGNRRSTEVDYIGGNFHPLLHREALKGDQGPFTPGLFFGLEELDAGLRLKSQGGRILAYDDLALDLGYAERMSHLRPDGGPVSARRFYSWRNMVYIARVNRLWLVLFMTLGRIALSGIMRSVLHRSLAPTRLAWNAIIDGLLGRLGAPTALPAKRAGAGDRLRRLDTPPTAS